MKIKGDMLMGMIMRIGERYKSYVELATMGKVPEAEGGIIYWRERLFSKFITFLLPTCLFALVPGVIMAFKSRFLFIAYADMLVVISIAAVSLNSRLNLQFRKIFVIVVLYLLSIALIIDLSLLGPGIVYLLALSVLVTIIFPRYYGYWTVGANLVICVCCGFIIHFRLFDCLLTKDYDLGTWIAVSSNEIFLSFIMVILISNTIKGLEKVIARELVFKKELQDEVCKGIKINEQLTESESHYKSLFFQNPSPMWILDNETLQFLQVNESAIAQYGYTNEEFLSMNVKDVKIEKDMEALHANMRRSKDDGSIVSTVTTHRRKSQVQFFVKVTFNSILFNGRSAMLAICQDITEQVNYIQAIESQNEKFREIGMIQSHKVRGPLATILGLVSLFNHEEIEVDTDDIIQGILYSSNQLDAVIKDIVDKSAIADIEISRIAGTLSSDISKLVV